MIRHILQSNKLFQQLMSPHSLRNPILFKFSTNNQNENKQKQQKEQNKQNPKIKLKFGVNHKLLTSLKKKIVFNIKKKQIENQMLSWFNNTMKKMQTKQSSEKSQEKAKEGQKQQKKQQKSAGPQPPKFQFRRPFFMFMFFYFFVLPFFNFKQKRHNQRRNIDNILSEIQKSFQICKLKVKQEAIQQISVYCEIDVGRHYLIKVNEQQLVYMLERLETIKNGSTVVQFLPNNIFMAHFAMEGNGKFFIQLMLVGLAIIAWRFYKKSAAVGSKGLNILDTKKFEAVKPESIKLNFKDVAGMHQAKFEITQFVQFLKRPDKYIEMGAKVPKGALLTGPPGTGKTLLAKACAGEAGVPFYSVSGSDFVEKFTGLGASRVRSLFDEAEKNSPSIIFIDQIDAIGKKRDSGPFSNQQRDNTLNQLLVRMDGFDTKNKVIVMAATNRKDMLDPALLRPGRFDRSVEIGLPSLDERVEILKVHLKKIIYQNTFTLDDLAKKIARITPGFSGAQLANTCNEAAILAARDAKQSVSMANFQKATQRVLAGLEKRNMFSEEQKQMLAYYEAGKAVANWFTQGADPVIKISILPFSKSRAGYSHSIRDETALNTKQELLAKVCCYLAGRQAEQHFKGHVSTNGNNDLQRAKKIITMIVTKFGMSDSLKMIAFPDFDFTRKPYSQKIQSLIDSEISKIIQQCQQKVQALIRQKQPQIEALKQKILQKQTLNHKQIKEILGERPFASGENYQQYLKDQEPEQSRRPNQGPRAGVASG